MPPIASRRAALALLALTSGCAGRAPSPGREGWSCVPYARLVSGLDLRGDAADWWEAARSRYRRDATPRLGSVLVLARTRSLPDGHVSVVTALEGPRSIRVAHANWAQGSAKGRIALDQPVRDISASGDWSRVEVWYPPIRGFGRTAYAAHGFVHPARPASREELASRVEGSLAADPA